MSWFEALKRTPWKIRNSTAPKSVIKIVYHALYIIRVIKIHAAVHTTVQKYQGELKSLSLPPVSVYFRWNVKVFLAALNVYFGKIVSRDDLFIKIVFTKLWPTPYIDRQHIHPNIIQFSYLGAVNRMIYVGVLY
jgi:hypothetical protein